MGEDEKQGIAQRLQCQREGFDEAIMDSTKMFEWRRTKKQVEGRVAWTLFEHEKQKIEARAVNCKNSECQNLQNIRRFRKGSGLQLKRRETLR